MSDNSYSQAEAQMASIIEMVAALECDYDRLEELEGERRDLEEAQQEAREELDAAKQEPADLEVNSVEWNAALDQIEAKESDYDQAVTDLEKWDAECAEELAALKEAAGDCTSRDEAAQIIQEDPLSVEVRSDWYSPGSEDNKPSEFQVLLCTGGPAVRVMGQLDERGQPERAWIEHQDWFEGWQEYHGPHENQDALLTYCKTFYFWE